MTSTDRRWRVPRGSRRVASRTSRSTQTPRARGRPTRPTGASRLAPVGCGRRRLGGVLGILETAGLRPPHLEPLRPAHGMDVALAELAARAEDDERDGERQDEQAPAEPDVELVDL